MTLLQYAGIAAILSLPSCSVRHPRSNGVFQPVHGRIGFTTNLLPKIVLIHDLAGQLRLGRMAEFEKLKNQLRESPTTVRTARFVITNDRKERAENFVLKLKY